MRESFLARIDKKNVEKVKNFLLESGWDGLAWALKHGSSYVSEPEDMLRLAMLRISDEREEAKMALDALVDFWIAKSREIGHGAAMSVHRNLVKIIFVGISLNDEFLVNRGIAAFPSAEESAKDILSRRFRFGSDFPGLGKKIHELAKTNSAGKSSLSLLEFSACSENGFAFRKLVDFGLRPILSNGLGEVGSLEMVLLMSGSPKSDSRIDKLLSLGAYRDLPMAPELESEFPTLFHMLFDVLGAPAVANIVSGKPDLLSFATPELRSKIELSMLPPVDCQPRESKKFV